ncbi:MAG: hypothetical protein ACRDJP_11700 [Actinomycetota bacterium]
MSIASSLRRVMRGARPRFQSEVEAVVAPAYARKEDLDDAVARLERAIDDVRRLVADQADASTEAETILGRELAALRDSVERLEQP